MQPIQLPALRPSQVYQGSPLHSGSMPRFMGNSSPPTYANFDTPSGTTSCTSYLPACNYGNNTTSARRATINSGPSSSTSSIIATPPALRSITTGAPISVTDIPPSLSSFKTITGGSSIHAPPPCEWTCDTTAIPFLSGLHYDYYPLADKSASGSTASSPSLPTLPSTSFCPDLFDPSSTMSYPQLNSGVSTSFPGMMTLSGSSQFAPADITQSLRSARSANPPAREIMTRTTPATTASITTRASKSESQSRAREKRHGCWMCEKSFDRPSTLRKHLLVHTGVKAFVCETCGRRFGVASNLNRHIKRCVLKPVNLANRASQSNVVDRHPSSNGGSSVESPSTSAGGTNVPESSTSPAPLQQSIKRARVLEPEAPEASEASTHSSTPSSSAAGTAPQKPPTKRRRRAPSPSLWVPQSLARYNILPIDYPPTSVPLPPVSPARDPLSNDWIEERNSWDEDVAAAPYHPCGWKGVLPGPRFASGVKDSSDGGLVNNGAYVMGRLVMV